MLRLVVETILSAAVAFGTTLSPLFADGVTPSEWTAAGVAACVSALAMLRQQPKKK